MFHFEAEAKLKAAEQGEDTLANDEVREGRLVVGEAPAPKKTLKKKHK